MSLLQRIEREAGLNLAEPDAAHGLAGFFNKYRPNGQGLERLLGTAGVEGRVGLRILKVFAATASSWIPGEPYFVVRAPQRVSPLEATALATRYLQSMASFVALRGEHELSMQLASTIVKFCEPPTSAPPDDTEIALYEVIVDFLAERSCEHELFLLQEALYSMANDYFLVVYMLGPIFEERGVPAGLMDSYFEMWRLDIRLTFSMKDGVFVFQR